MIAQQLQGRHYGNEEMSDVRKDSDAMLVYSRLHLGVGKFRVCVTLIVNRLHIAGVERPSGAGKVGV